MSVQKHEYKSKKTGKTKTWYYASVWYAAEGRTITGTYRETKKEARQDETDIQRNIDAGKAKATKKQRSTTVDAIFDLWHEATAPPVYANSTWRVYERFYKKYIKEVFGDKKVSAITAIHVQRYINIIKEKYQPETVNKCLNILVDIFNFSIDPLKCITDNPAAGIKRCKVTTKKKATWTDDMISYFLQLPEVRASHYYPMFCLSAMLGPRPGEVCGLRENALCSKPSYSIDFDRGYDNWECETDLKSKRSHRTPPIPKYLYDVIHRKLIWKRKERLADNEWGQNDYLFVAESGNPIKPDQLGKAFSKLLKAHNERMEEYETTHGKLPESGQKLPHIGLYGFRTSFATNNMRRCPNAALISSVMGNSPKTLLQFYAQSDMEMQAELINGYTGGTMEKAVQ